MAPVRPPPAIEYLLVRPDAGDVEPEPHDASAFKEGTAGVPLAVLLGSFPVWQVDGLHALIQAARLGDPRAVESELAGVADALPEAWPDLHTALVYAVPGHQPGGSSPLVEAAAGSIAARRGWQLRLGALTRSRPSPQGKRGGERNPTSESSTLSVTASGSAGDDRAAAIVLVDDVVRSGASLLACAEAIRGSSDVRPIVAIVIGRAARDAPEGVHSRLQRNCRTVDRTTG